MKIYAQITKPLRTFSLWYIDTKINSVSQPHSLQINDDIYCPKEVYNEKRLAVQIIIEQEEENKKTC